MTVWEVPEKGCLPVYRPVWLDRGATHQEAFSKAATEEDALGVLCRPGGGVGVRVPAKDFAALCARLLNPETAARLAGDRYMVKGLPQSWSSAAMSSCLRRMGWDAHPERSVFETGGTRKFFIRSTNAPPNKFPGTHRRGGALSHKPMRCHTLGQAGRHGQGPGAKSLYFQTSQIPRQGEERQCTGHGSRQTSNSSPSEFNSPNHMAFWWPTGHRLDRRSVSRHAATAKEGSGGSTESPRRLGRRGHGRQRTHSGCGRWRSHHSASWRHGGRRHGIVQPAGRTGFGGAAATESDGRHDAPTERTAGFARHTTCFCAWPCTVPGSHAELHATRWKRTCPPGHPRCRGCACGRKRQQQSIPHSGPTTPSGRARQGKQPGQQARGQLPKKEKSEPRGPGQTFCVLKRPHTLKPNTMESLSFPPLPDRTDGEASNPGPSTWSALNCTAMRSQFHQILALQSDVSFLTEVRLPAAGQAIMKQKLEANGYNVLWGAPRPQRRFNGPVKAGGVAIISKTGC